MTGSTLIKNAQVNSANWIDMRATQVTWSQDVGTDIPTTPVKSGIPPIQGNWMGVDNPGITVQGLINYGNEQANVMNFHFLEQLACQTGLSWFHEKYFTSGNNPYHVGSIGVFTKSFTATRTSKRPLEMTYTVVLITTSGT